MADKKIKCVKIRRTETNGQMWSLTPLASYSLADEFDGSDPGDQIEVEYCEMTQAEIDALPDFEGW